MSLPLSLIGATLIVASSFLLSRAYSGFLRKRCSESEELYRFILHIKGEVGRFLTPPERLLGEFSSPVLEAVGFTEKALERGNLYSAFLKVRDRLSVSADVKKIVGDFLEGFGSDYRDGEIKRCDAYAEELEGVIHREREELERGERLVRAVLCASSLGIVILLI